MEAQKDENEDIAEEHDQDHQIKINFKPLDNSPNNFLRMVSGLSFDD